MTEMKLFYINYNFYSVRRWLPACFPEAEGGCFCPGQAWWPNSASLRAMSHPNSGFSLGFHLLAAASPGCLASPSAAASGTSNIRQIQTKQKGEVPVLSAAALQPTSEQRTWCNHSGCWLLCLALGQNLLARSTQVARKDFLISCCFLSVQSI